MLSKCVVSLKIIVIAFLLVGCKSDSSPGDIETIRAIATVTETEVVIPTQGTITTPTSKEQSISEHDYHLWLSNLLMENGSCDFPCVLGLRPGTKLQENHLEKFNPISIYDEVSIHENSGTFYGKLPFDDSNLFISFYLRYKLNTNDEIQTIEFSSSLLEETGSGEGYRDIFSNEKFYEILDDYSLEKILQQFGSPEQIIIYVDLGQLEQPILYRPFIYWLDYSQQGFIVSYTTEAIETDKSFLGCLKNSRFDLYVLHGNNVLQDYIEEFQKVNIPPNIDPFMPIEMASSVTIENFTEIFISDPNYCLEVEKDIWPLP